MNVAIQLFTFDQTRKALELLHGLSVVINGAQNAKVIWSEHDGASRKVAVESVLAASAKDLQLNEAYVQVPVRKISEKLAGVRPRALTIHLSVSPDCELWARSTKPAPPGRPGVRRVLGYVQSLEKAAAFRKVKPMPTVLEITVVCEENRIDLLLKTFAEVVRETWPLMGCAGKFVTLDCGEDWLFFPKSGYNPNISDIHVYFSSEARSAWPTWRGRHNASFAQEAADPAAPAMIVHSFAPRTQPTS